MIPIKSSNTTLSRLSLQVGGIEAIIVPTTSYFNNCLIPRPLWWINIKSYRQDAYDKDLCLIEGRRNRQESYCSKHAAETCALIEEIDWQDAYYKDSNQDWRKINRQEAHCRV
jgi:hypothetical protein